MVGKVLEIVEHLKELALMHWVSEVSSTGEDGLPNPGWFSEVLQACKLPKAKNQTKPKNT